MDSPGKIRAVCVVHNEDLHRITLAHCRGAQGHGCMPAIRHCLMVDTISSLASIDYRHDEWGVDVSKKHSKKTVPRLAESCLLRHLCCRPAFRHLSTQNLSARAIAESETSGINRSCTNWDWHEQIAIDCQFAHPVPFPTRRNKRRTCFMASPRQSTCLK